MASKVLPLKDAVALISDGMNLTIGGFGHSLTPLAFVREMIRQRKKNICLTSMGEAWAADYLCGAGCIKTVRFSNFMFEGYGRCRNFSRAVERGEIQVEDYSHFGITNRLVAAGLGIPFLPVGVMAGTDITRITALPEQKFATIDSPFDGRRVMVVPMIEPDFAIIHASRADSEGNTQLFGFKSIVEEQARAAKKVIVTVEEIVPTEEIRRHPEFTIIPGFLVSAVVEVPYGAHPGGMYRYYDYDPVHIATYLEASQQPESFVKYLDDYVYGVRDHTEYLERIGIKRLMELRADPVLGYSLIVRGEKDE